MLGDMTTNGAITDGLGGGRRADLSPLNWYGDLADESVVDSATAKRGNSVMTALLRR